MTGGPELNKEFLSHRGKALEEEFFSIQSEQLKRALRETEANTARRQALSDASGISNDVVLDQLMALDVSAQTVTALRLVPLIETAWADGRMEETEREAVLNAARKILAIECGSPAYGLLESWLTAQPDRQLIAAWKAYTAAICAVLDTLARERFTEEIMGAAKDVAEAAGGILGIGAISSVEKNKLAELEQAFHVG